VNSVPDVLTNPVETGDGTPDVGPGLVAVFDGGIVGEIAPGMHCEYQSFW